MRKTFSSLICQFLNKTVPFLCPRYFIRDIRSKNQFSIERIGGNSRILSLQEIKSNDWIYQGLIYRDKCYIEQLIQHENNSHPKQQ